VFGSACDSALITSIVSEWRPFSFIFKQGNRKESWGMKLDKKGGWGTTVMLLLVKSSVVEKEV
jgi:hypothetical protein